MPGNGPRPCGRQSIACRVADPLWMSTVSGPPDVWPQAVATVSARTSSARTNAYSFVIWQPPSLDSTDATDAAGMGQVYLKLRPRKIVKLQKQSQRPTCEIHLWAHAST